MKRVAAGLAVVLAAAVSSAPAHAAAQSQVGVTCGLAGTPVGGNVVAVLAAGFVAVDTAHLNANPVYAASDCEIKVNGGTVADFAFTDVVGAVAPLVAVDPVLDASPESADVVTVCTTLYSRDAYGSTTTSSCDDAVWTRVVPRPVCDPCVAGPVWLLTLVPKPVVRL